MFSLSYWRPRWFVSYRTAEFRITSRYSSTYMTFLLYPVDSLYIRDTWFILTIKMLASYTRCMCRSLMGNFRFHKLLASCTLVGLLSNSNFIGLLHRSDRWTYAASAHRGPVTCSATLPISIFGCAYSLNYWRSNGGCDKLSINFSWTSPCPKFLQCCNLGE